jgi:hypothetical protein
MRWPKKEGVIGWRKLHNEEVHNLYACSLRNISPIKLMKSRTV